MGGETADQKSRFKLVLGRSRAMTSIFGLLQRVAPSTLSVLIEGETGTGKEAVARSIHLSSERKDRPFVVSFRPGTESTSSLTYVLSPPRK